MSRTVTLTAGCQDRGYIACECESSGDGTLRYRAKRGGTRARWQRVIQQINEGGMFVAYTTPALEALPVLLEIRALDAGRTKPTTLKASLQESRRRVPLAS